MPHHLDYQAAILRDGLAMADAAEAAGPAAPIAGCPDWDASELVWHLTQVHYFWGTIVAGRLLDPGQVPALERPGGFDALLARLRSGVRWIAEVLTAADPATPVWTWARQQDAAFVIRHQAQETAVHRWDAERAAGRSFAIDPAIAADAIDEFLEHTGAARREGTEAVGGSVHLHATDANGEWTIGEDAAGNLAVERGHRHGDAAVRGTASDLLLLLYGRIGREALEAHGDIRVLDRLLARADLS